MTTEVTAPVHTGADKRPKRSRTKTLLPWLMVAVWIGLLVGGYSLAGRLDSVTRDGQADYLPASAQSTKVLQAEAGLPGGENGLLMVVYERPGGLQPGDREAVERGQSELAERFGNDTDTLPEIVDSDDGTALMYALPLGRDAVAEEAGATAVNRGTLCGGVHSPDAGICR